MNETLLLNLILVLTITLILTSNCSSPSPTPQEGWVTGWGARASGGGPSSVLRRVELPIMDNIDCILMFK